jgi:hypothetical protein
MNLKNFHRDLEPLISQHKKELTKNMYCQRMLAFSLSGTYIVDLKDQSQMMLNRGVSTKL